jgi:hypothetical protein
VTRRKRKRKTRDEKLTAVIISGNQQVIQSVVDFKENASSQLSEIKSQIKTAVEELDAVIGMVATLAEGPGSSEASQHLLASNSNIKVVQDALIVVQKTLAAAIMVGTLAEGQAPTPGDTVDSYEDGDME